MRGAAADATGRRQELALFFLLLVLRPHAPPGDGFEMVTADSAPVVRTLFPPPAEAPPALDDSEAKDAESSGPFVVGSVRLDDI